MCGIAGIIAPRGQAPGREALERMALAEAHRGPDGQGIALSGRAGLAHRRLAVIDLVTGDQPMANEDGRVRIVFNGEIYNHQQLRRELEAKGHTFATASDTEAIVHAYEEYGPACVEKLRGMFAFAIWDERDGMLFAARDRLGKKPFHYALHEGHFLFASEPAALLAFPGLSRQPDMEALGLYLTLQYVPDPFCAFAHIRKLPAGHTLTFRDGSVATRRYWRLRFEPKATACEQELAEELRALVTESTRLRLIADVPLGAHLSGGIDSSIVTAVMAGLCDRPVKTFSIGFREEAFSELHKARAVAARYGTDHTEFVVEYGHVPATLERIVAHVGEPFADPAALPAWFLARETRAAVTVAVNGDGGDELFAGYQRMWLDRLARLYRLLPGFVTGGLVPAVAGLIPSRAGKPIEKDWAEAAKRLSQVVAAGPKAGIIGWGSYFSPQAAQRLWRPEAAPQADPVALVARAFDAALAANSLDRTLSADLDTYLPGCLLVKADRMAMAHGLEGRSPLLDHRLAEWAARLPAELKLRGRTGKYLLRKAFARLLPPEVTAQGKQGFGVPVGAWLRGGLKGWSRELLLEGVAAKSLFRPEEIARLLGEHQSGRADHGKRIWALAALELWLRAHAPGGV